MSSRPSDFHVSACASVQHRIDHQPAAPYCDWINDVPGGQTMRPRVICVAVLWVAACSSDAIKTSSMEQDGRQLQGRQLQGTQLQGTQVQGMTLSGFQFAGATLNGAPLDNLRVVQGQLMAEQNQITLQGTDLVNAHVFAQVHNASTTAVVEYQITDIEAEDPAYDPTHTGSTFLYSLSQNVDNTGSWQPACGSDADGRSAAIPL